VRIVHVIARLNDGGPARIVANLARMMRAHGHESIVLTGTTSDDEPDLADALAADGLRVERIPALGRSARPIGDARAGLALIARLRALAPDVVHTHTAKAGALGRITCRIDRRPCLHTYHGHVLSGYFGTTVSAGLRAAERLLAHGAHHHALTASQHHELAGRYRIGTRARWHVLPPPVDPVVPRAAPWHARLDLGAPRIGFLGRLAPVKDGALWLEALSWLTARRPVQGVICGDGRERDAIIARATSLGVSVVVTGQVPAAEALGAFDLLLMSSRNEGLPLAAVEAMSAGVAVVAPAVGGLIDLGRAGAIESAPRDAFALADACQRLLDGPELRARRVAAGRAVAAALAPMALAARYDALYREVASDRCARGS